MGGIDGREGGHDVGYPSRSDRPSCLDTRNGPRRAKKLENPHKRDPVATVAGDGPRGPIGHFTEVGVESGRGRTHGLRRPAWRLSGLTLVHQTTRFGVAEAASPAREHPCARPRAEAELGTRCWQVLVVEDSPSYAALIEQMLLDRLGAETITWWRGHAGRRGGAVGGWRVDRLRVARSVVARRRGAGCGPGSAGGRPGGARGRANGY